MTLVDSLELVDWRRRMGDAYRESSLGAWREARDQLFGGHPQSPIPAGRRAAFQGLRWFPPDPTYRVQAAVETTDPSPLEIDTGGEDGVISYRRSGRLRFQLQGRECSLTVFSLQGYGGGLFLPFTDATSGRETYGGGRYLFDTIKNTDAGCLDFQLGAAEVTIDFNYAYHPSCHYNPRWACPLAPPENRLAVAVRAGEVSYPAEEGL
ncbi:MAG: DUF1684 domain-containing protein [Candidatus Dormibacter sp.]|uniref:DUF1684 domain-containing protein n=1 Tax=Candidatus Dormibacter sp. TaxID=2973982 RepID=UPI000DB7A250|nr:MAG: hypothetical protein DLM66_05820 [Candidatus Dormibacteraeota bacterium]